MSQWDIKASDLQCIEKVNPNSIIVSRSAGGQLFGAHKIAQLIKDRGIDVHVNKECLSACTIILAAASKSTMCKSASIGVHHFGSNGKAVRNNQVLREHIDLMASFGINKKGYSDIMVNTPYTRFHYMNNKEMRDLGFITNVSLKCS
ncbi:hypothetical protein LMH73_009835 [Vibrio splendidus]|nr:hypothetical protein [Vibrio splendidus]MCC4883038.1 hypothetical protein [Vibrio splendidus]